MAQHDAGTAEGRPAHEEQRRGCKKNTKWRTNRRKERGKTIFIS